LLIALVLATVSADAGAQPCSGFPWTVSAVPAGGRSVAVGICGTSSGCQPHNPQFTVLGSEIRVSLTEGETPGCQCLADPVTFRRNVIVSPVEPGNYTVRVVRIDCGVQSDAGTTTLDFPASSAIPALDRRGIAALALLTALAAIRALQA
jgi:hypothetical protein